MQKIIENAVQCLKDAKALAKAKADEKYGAYKAEENFLRGVAHAEERLSGFLSEELVRIAKQTEKRELKEGAFVECASCFAQPGAPVLCVSCVHNRDVIARLTMEVRRLWEVGMPLLANLEQLGVNEWNAASTAAIAELRAQFPASFERFFRPVLRAKSWSGEPETDQEANERLKVIESEAEDTWGGK